MNLESDKRLNIQLRLDSSSVPTGEARQAGRGDIESLAVVNESERPADTSRVNRSALAQLLEPPYTDPYVRWCGRGGVVRLPPIPINGTWLPHGNVRINGEYWRVSGPFERVSVTPPSVYLPTASYICSTRAARDK
jgi:hypothetical protein